jgi:methylenetetrahydrofolate reductase (NADPH)
MIDLNFLGIENVVALRGDQAKHESYFTPHKEGNAFAIDLVRSSTMSRIMDGIRI